MAEQLSETLEDYMRTIFLLQKEKQFTRSRDIAQSLHVTKSAVTAALKTLSEKRLVNYKPYEPVTFSNAGRKMGREITLRYYIMKNFLENVLNLNHKKSNLVASRMEHAIDPETLKRFVCFLAFIGKCQDGKKTWLTKFKHFIQEGTETQTCSECITEYVRILKKLNT